MSNWYLPLSTDAYDFKDGSLKHFTRENWFNPDACVVMGESGSMTQGIIPRFMEHRNSFVRNFVPCEKHFVLLLDGHSSRNGLDWLEYASAHRCEVVQSPANTSHFLQPCDQDVYKKLADTIRRVRDKLCLASRGATDTRTIQTKLMFGTTGLEAITSTDIRRSWYVTGLWPMDYRFAEKYKRNKDEVVLEADKQLQAVAHAGPTASLMSVRQRRSDNDTFRTLAAIVDAARKDGCTRVSKALQNASICLTNHQTVNNILMAKERSVMSTAVTIVSGNECPPKPKTKNVMLSAGAPAQYLTHKDLLEKKRLEEREEIAKQEAKVAAKAAAAAAKAEAKAAAVAAKAEKQKQREAKKKNPKRCTTIRKKKSC